MKYVVKIFLFVFIILTFPSFAQSSKKDELIKAKQEYFNYNLKPAQKLFEEIIKKDSNNVEVLCYLANIYRLDDNFTDAVSLLDKALSIDNNNSYALTLLGDVYNPQYSYNSNADYEIAFQFYSTAISKNPKDANPCLGLWIEGMRRRRIDVELGALKSLYETGFFTKKVINYNRTILKSLPKDAIILVNGDLDTYPMLAIQYVEGLRNDVAIVNVSMLSMFWYTQLIAERTGIRKYVSDSLAFDTLFTYKSTPGDKLVDSIKNDFKAGLLKRPLALSFTLDGQYYSEDDFFYYDMFFYQYLKDSVGTGYNFKQIKDFYKNIKIEDYSGDVASKMDLSPIRNSHNKSSFIDNNIVSYAMNIAYYYKTNGNDKEAKFYLDFVDKNYKKLNFEKEDFPKIKQAVKEIRDL